MNSYRVGPDSWASRLLGACLTLLAAAVAVHVAVGLVQQDWPWIVGVGSTVLKVHGETVCRAPRHTRPHPARWTVPAATPMNTTTRTEYKSTLASLRGLVPTRTMSLAEALRLADLQATKFRTLLSIEGEALPEEAISELPRIRVVRRALPTSGMSYWDGQEWVIALNVREPEARQRFTLLHEYKHILDHGRTDRLYTGSRSADAGKQAEQAADYFAGCVLMPRMLVKRAWTAGKQTPEELAEVFEVSPRAAEVRIAQLGLTDPIQRCDPVATTTWQRGRGRYFRLATWTSGELRTT